jgi:diaminopimelate decarboxylase
MSSAAAVDMELVPAVTDEQAREAQKRFGTPVYVYSEAALVTAAREVLAFPNAYGLTARYAMKACPTAAVVRVLHDEGLHIDASSGFEAERAMRAGVPAAHIQLTAQQMPENLRELVEKGVQFNACSLHQLRTYGQLFPGAEVSVRINPGKGSGHSNRTNVGGPSSSFGIWHEHLEEVLSAAREFDLRITGMHTHIGSGADPSVWDHCAQLSLGIAGRLPEVNRLSLGGGFKVARMEGEKQADLQEIGAKIAKDFENFAQEHGRKLRLEVEPGTYLVANAGAVICTVIDVVDTGAGGYRFIKVDSGMTEVLRPALYGAQHPMRIVAADARALDETYEFLVAGHCCESGDILTPEPGNPEGLRPRLLYAPKAGDILVIGGAGAYCSGLAAKNYNSFPEAPEAMVTASGELKLIRQRQTFEQMVGNEVG